MENQYLEKISSSVEDVQKEVNDGWTIFGKRNALRRNGYDVGLKDVIKLNQKSRDVDSWRSIKNSLGSRLIGAGGGAGIGYALSGNKSGALLGSFVGGLAGAITGDLVEAHAVKKDYNELLRQKIESGEWPTIEKSATIKDTIDMDMDSSGKLRLVKDIYPGMGPKPGFKDITPVSTKNKFLRAGAGILGAGSLIAGAVHLNRSAHKDSKLKGKAAKSNKYLEKAADFNQMSAKANKITGAPAAPGPKRSWFSENPADKFKAKPLSQGASQIRDHLNATGESLSSRLKSNAEKVTSKAALPKGKVENKLLSRVGGFIKKNPLLSAGGALAGGVLLGHKSSQPQQPSYGNYM